MKRNVMFKILLMIVVGLFLSLDAFAQQMTVKGIVKDTTGEPIIGANVVVKGSSNGTITDFEGNFQFNANKGDIIVISFGGSKAGIEAVKEGKLNVTFECNPGQGPKAAELIQRLESDISIDKEQYVEETYFDGTMDLDEIIENRTY